MGLLVVTLLGGYRLAVPEGVAADATPEPAAPANEQPDTPPATPAQEQPEVLSRGPVHEAFAAPIDLEPQEGPLTPVQPPPHIDEIPPAERPQGRQFVWIPGYWSWDAERNGYLWVGACWRVTPPGRAWVPGYWAEVPGGWKWVAGFWAPAGVAEIEYLPAPPAVDTAADDVQPRGAAPSPDTIWVPPCMYWVQGQYSRRAGYWLAAQPDWVWEPSHYVWTPRGYIFAEGHWDYSVERRGVFFAPVSFPASVYRRVDYTYSPSIVIDVGLLRLNLFAYPRYSHYYFGDYYDDAYLRLGIYPWFDSHRRHTWYDPIYEHDRWHHRGTEPRWEERERGEYDRRRADKDLRPARTFREQEARLAKLPEPQRRAAQVAQPMAVAVANRVTPLKFERINADTRQKISKQATAVRTFRDERTRWESTAAAGSKPAQLPKERRPAVIPPAEREATAPPPKERKPALVPPAERKEATTPAEPREPAVVPPREAKVPRSERVKIPAPPVADRSGGPDALQKDLPARPADEDRDREDTPKNSRAADKETRKDGGGRHGD